MAPVAPPDSAQFSLAGKTALVTGSGGGIGRLLAAGLGRAGAVVAVHDRTSDSCDATSELLRECGVTFTVFAADLGSVGECRGLVAQVHRDFGQIDVLVNCAAANRREPVSDVTPETFDWLVAVNVRAPFFLSQAVQPLMRASGGGKIINVSSINAHYALGGVGVYGLTKGALRQMTAEMAVEFAPDNIQVNALTPGFVVTPMNEKSLWSDPRSRGWILDRVPAGRPALPADLVGAAVFLASPASDFVTGQSVVIDGGFTAGGSWAYQGPAGPSRADKGTREEQRP